MALHLMSKIANEDQAGWVTWVAGASSNDIDIDNDGVMPDTRLIIDISQALSQRLGKQMSMMSTYKVNYIGIQLVNVDDVNDNDGAAEFSGRIHYYEPSKHRIDAMQLARQTEKAAETVDVDSNSFLLRTTNVYNGMRFNWDSDSQVAYATAEGFSALTGGFWDLNELFFVYDSMLGDKMSDAVNKLWANRTGYESQLGFTVAYQNSQGANLQGYSPLNRPFIFQSSNPIEVLGGLLMIDFENSSTDTPQAIDDDYQVMITIGVSGWSDF